MTGDNVGDLLAFIPSGDRQFRAYVLDTEEDIDNIQAALGIEIVGSWGLYDAESNPAEDPSQCVDRLFREYAQTLTDFPTTIDFSQKTLEVLYHCIKNFGSISNDDRLLQGLEEEYRLFQMVERLLCQNQINRVFRSVDEFLETAQSILQRRKARAGRSFENHVAHLLKIEKIPFTEQPVVDGRPDFIIPSMDAYLDISYPADRLIVLATKRTCKDRWRQVTREAKRIKTKHLLTIQKGISSPQLEEMRSSDVCLIVPKKLHRMYPKDKREALVSIDQFIDSARTIVR